MNVPIVKELTLDELKTQLEAAFPNVKGNYAPGNKMLMISQNGEKAGVSVQVRKNKVVLYNGFSSMGAQMLFMLLLVVTAGVIGGAIFLFVIKPKQDAIRKKVAEFVQSNYGQASF